VKPASKVYPNVTITVKGHVTRRMKVGLLVMRFGARLVNNGGVEIAYSSNIVKRATEALGGEQR
jgi:hypothetical protein